MTTQTSSHQPSTKLRILVIGVGTVILILVSSASLLSHAQTKVPYEKERLIRGLKQSAVDKKLTQQDFVRLIAERGVDFQMTPRDETELRMAGASNEVIEAIRMSYRHIPKPLPKGAGALTISSMIPDCKVFINGQLRGNTDINGLLRLPPLKAGQYRVVLKKENYEEQTRSVQVTAGAESSESFSLLPMKGSLTIVPVPADAKVTLNGTEYPQGIKNFPLEPGSHTVRVSKQGFKSVDRTATVEPGRPSSMSVILEVFRIEEMLAEAIESLKQKNYAKATSLSRDILNAKPEEPKANLVLGLSYLNSGNFEAAVVVLVKAISLGEQVGIPYQHHTTYGIYPRSDNLTPGVLIIGKNLLEFRTFGGSTLFSVPLEKVYRVLPEDNRGGRLQLKIGNPKKKKDDGKDYNLHPIQAGLRQVMVGTSVTTAIYCQNCFPIAQATYQLVQQVQLSSQSALPAKL